MTGISPPKTLRLVVATPTSAEKVRTRAISAHTLAHCDTEHRFSSWISSHAIATGVAGNPIVGGAESFLDMFGPIGS